MNIEQQLKLQAFLDGELPEAEAREVAAWIARDQDAAALHAELRNTRQALNGAEADIKLPESREFYWSKIKREIERTAPVAKPEPTVSPFHWLRQILIPAGALAVIAIAALLALPSHFAASGPELVAEQSDANAFTFRDEESKVTLVWFSYNSENGLADNHSAVTLQ